VTGILTPVGRNAAGQPRTYRLQRPATREAAYRRLAIAILGLDVPTLASELRAARRTHRQTADVSARLLEPAA
jgi:hypothetical protein